MKRNLCALIVLFISLFSVTAYGFPQETLDWNYSDCVLTISGTGEMLNYSLDFRPPWNIYKQDVKTINIQEGVTTIGILAFWEYSNLQEVNISNSVRVIYEGAFKGCTKLKSIIIPDNTKIEETAFPTTTIQINASTPTYKVVFDANGGKALYGEFETATVQNGDSVTIPMMPAKREGHMFLGWSLDKNAKEATWESSNRETETKVSFNKDTTLYAIYKDLRLFDTEMILKNRMFASSPTHGFLILPDRTVEAYLGTAVCECTISNVYCPFCDIHNNSDFKDIVKLEYGANNLYGLRFDGTVARVGGYAHDISGNIIDPNAWGQQNVSNWTEVVSISASGDHILGLRSDGTVYASGNNEYGQCNVGQWTDIIQIDTVNDLSVGLKSNGRVVYAGRDYVTNSWISENGEENIFERFDSQPVTNVIKVAAVSGLNANFESLAIVYLSGDGTLSAVGDKGAFAALNDILYPNTLWFKADEGRVIAMRKDGSLVGCGNSVEGLSLYKLNENIYLKNICNFDFDRDSFCVVTNSNELITSKLGGSTYMRTDEIYGSFIQNDKLFMFNQYDTGNVSSVKCIGNWLLYTNSDGMLFSVLKGTAELPKYIGIYPPNIIFNDAPLFGEAEPVISNGRTLVPLRMIFEKIGANVKWEQETQTITAEKDEITVTMKIGDSVFYKNSSPVSLDVAPQIIYGKTMVPVRAIAESFGCDVAWSAESRTVIISNN